jgi:hypothetical protein
VLQDVCVRRTERPSATRVEDAFNPSPSMLAAITVSVIANSGKAAVHQTMRING